MARTRSRSNNKPFFCAKTFVEFLDQFLEVRTAHDLNGGAVPHGGSWRGSGDTPRLKGETGVFLNGVKLHGGGQGADYRKIHRWRSGTSKGVTLDVADKLLLRYSLSLTEFEDWAEENGKDHLLNGENRYG